MRQTLQRVFRSMLVVAACLVAAMTVKLPSFAQDTEVTQVAGVDNAKMGAYRSLARLVLQALRKGDKVGAAELARILERTWDAAEEHGGEMSLAKRNKRAFEQADRAMDLFIKPVIDYTAKSPNFATVEAAYSDFLGTLLLGD